MVIEVKKSIKILQKASTELIVDLEAIKEQQLILLWLLFITASIGFMF